MKNYVEQLTELLEAKMQEIKDKEARIAALERSQRRLAKEYADKIICATCGLDKCPTIKQCGTEECIRAIIDWSMSEEG